MPHIDRRQDIFNRCGADVIFARRPHVGATSANQIDSQPLLDLFSGGSRICSDETGEASFLSFPHHFSFAHVTHSRFLPPFTALPILLLFSRN